VKELDEPTARAFLGSHRFGVMALAREGEAYTVPLFYAYDGLALFFHSRHGEKDEFLAGTRQACFVVVDYQGDSDWTSVEARGPVHRVQTNSEADRAFKAISENPFPPEFGVDSHGRPERSGKNAYLWMMTPEQVTGRSSQSLARVKR
jgi:nitroimidazol reductase NimA-like FMN-containing flavoprotein (pyridoxamine 5'-phosphate oxidase superfamily)